MTLPDADAPLRSPEALLDDLIAEFERHYQDADAEPIRRAFEAANEAHLGQTRKSGEPFIIHPLIATEILAGYGMDGATLVAALLHDTVEDTELTIDEIGDRFGTEVAMLIDGVTKLDRIKFSSREEAQAASIRKMAIAMAKDIRVLLIKLADRLHNVRTLDALPPEKQERIASETLEIYAPLAHRLGVQEIKHEMEERCFAVLHPGAKTELEALVRQRTGERESHIEKAITQLNDALDDAGIESKVAGRPKHIYSIYRKMVSSGLGFEQIHDLIGIRILVNDLRDCYAVLGLVHTIWPPIHGRFKDYIAMPKFNGYQSLHTTVVGPDGTGLEVQIRTQEMHERAEFGIAAHWLYKEGGSPKDVDLVSDLRFLQEAHEHPEDFLESLKLDLYQDEVFALTPRGDVITLPRGATPVDFAYKVHTDVGHRCIGAKVNGRLVALSTEIDSGDIIEVITSNAADAHPSRDWLEFVKSSRASAKIRQWFTKERRENALSDGREQVTKAVRRLKVDAGQAEKDAGLRSTAEDLGFPALDALYIAVGDGRVAAGTVATRLGRLLEPEQEESDQDLLSPPPRRGTKRPQRGIEVEGFDDMLVRIARCCAPVPGDDIVGFVTVGRGVSVHRGDCANIGALGQRAERIIEVSWAPDQSDSFFVWIQVEALDRPRLLRDVTSVLSDMGANINASSSGTDRDRIAVLRYEVELSDRDALSRTIDALRAVQGVYDAYRLVPQGS
jgi:GTP pyrophosphokinase